MRIALNAAACLAVAPLLASCGPAASQVTSQPSGQAAERHYRRPPVHDAPVRAEAATAMRNRLFGGRTVDRATTYFRSSPRSRR